MVTWHIWTIATVAMFLWTAHFISLLMLSNLDPKLSHNSQLWLELSQSEIFLPIQKLLYSEFYFLIQNQHFWKIPVYHWKFFVDVCHWACMDLIPQYTCCVQYHIKAEINTNEQTCQSPETSSYRFWNRGWLNQLILSYLYRTWWDPKTLMASPLSQFQSSLIA